MRCPCGDLSDGYGRLLADILRAHLAATVIRQNAVAVQQNSDVRKISAWVAIAAVPTMIAGIYGMNVTFMPELTASVRINDREFHFGYFAVLLVMATCGVLMNRAFRRSGWL